MSASQDDLPLTTTWFDLDDQGGVLDLERPRLSLFVVVPSAGKTTCWWTTEDGTWLMKARVGLT